MAHCEHNHMPLSIRYCQTLYASIYRSVNLTNLLAISAPCFCLFGNGSPLDCNVKRLHSAEHVFSYIGVCLLCRVCCWLFAVFEIASRITRKLFTTRRQLTTNPSKQDLIIIS